jgi:hypothetical protein
LLQHHDRSIASTIDPFSSIMTEDNGGGNANGSNGSSAQIGTIRVKQGLAQMLKGGVIVSTCDIENGARRRTAFSFVQSTGDDVDRLSLLVDPSLSFL